LIDFTIEDLTSDEWILVTSVVTILWGWHNGNVVDQSFELVMVVILDEFVVVVFELLQAIVIVEKLINAAVFAVE